MKEEKRPLKVSSQRKRRSSKRTINVVLSYFVKLVAVYLLLVSYTTWLSISQSQGNQIVSMEDINEIPKRYNNKNTMIQPLQNSYNHNSSNNLPLTKTEKKKPIMYLHIGPRKTATTTIQSKLDDMKAELKSDGIAFFGKGKKLQRFGLMGFGFGWWRCSNDKRHPDCIHQIKESINSLYKNGTDVIISDEYLGRMLSKGEIPGKRYSFLDLKYFSNLQVKWDVRILLGYRPYFDVVLSEYNESWKMKHIKPMTNKWPKFGGKTIPMKRETWDMNGRLMNGVTAVDEIADKVAEHFDNIIVFDIRQSSDLMTHILCDIIENANTACQTQKQFVASGMKEVKVNVAASLDYQRLAIAASKKDLFNLSLSKISVVSAIQKYWEVDRNMKVSDFPMVCPPFDDIMTLYNITLAQEMRWFPERTRNDLHTLKAYFKKRVDQGAFCDVDVDKVLEEDEWKEFLSSLK